jgi:hypothetical protein
MLEKGTFDSSSQILVAHLGDGGLTENLHSLRFFRFLSPT